MRLGTVQIDQYPQFKSMKKIESTQKLHVLDVLDEKGLKHRAALCVKNLTRNESSKRLLA